MEYAGSNEDFERLYATVLEPSMADLHPLQQGSRTWAIIGGTAIAGLILSIILSSTGLLTGGVFMAIAFFLLIIASVVQYTRKRDAYVDAFKETIMRSIIRHLHPGILYRPDVRMSTSEYETSGLYLRNYESIDGDDYMEGIYKNVPFRCSELNTTRPRGRYSSDTVFNGLLFMAAISPSFRGGTYVWLKGREQLPASLADQYYRYLPLPNVYKVNAGDSTFQQYFAAYSTNPAEAQMLLTPFMTTRMVNMLRQFQRDITFSFVGGYCFVATSFQESLLDPPRISKDAKEELRNTYFTIVYILNIIDHLRLYDLL